MNDMLKNLRTNDLEIILKEAKDIIAKRNKKVIQISRQQIKDLKKRYNKLSRNWKMKIPIDTEVCIVKGRFEIYYDGVCDNDILDFQPNMKSEITKHNIERKQLCDDITALAKSTHHKIKDVLDKIDSNANYYLGIRIR